MNDDGVSLSSDLRRVEVEGHDTHVVIRLIAETTPGVMQAVLRACCSCGMIFKVTSKPRAPRCTSDQD